MREAASSLDDARLFGADVGEDGYVASMQACTYCTKSPTHATLPHFRRSLANNWESTFAFARAALEQYFLYALSASNLRRTRLAERLNAEIRESGVRVEFQTSQWQQNRREENITLKNASLRPAKACACALLNVKYYEVPAQFEIPSQRVFMLFEEAISPFLVELKNWLSVQGYGSSKKDADGVEGYSNAEKSFTLHVAATIASNVDGVGPEQKNFLCLIVLDADEPDEAWAKRKRSFREMSENLQ